jgi:predicted Ser/Thr protein kinase
MTSAPVVRIVGRYEILREVGHGGTAVVYLARQADLDRSVALKELAGLHARDPAFVERFLRESRVTGSLSHPNVVTVYEYFEHEGTAFIAMEYFERGSLRPLVGRLSLDQIAGVLEGVLAGLTYAEKHGVVHRDLKPENVMVTSAGGVKIADFGMAKARELQATGELTASGTTVGTPAYMAPEQALGQGVAPQADLYSVGIIAYELLTGSTPFDRDEAPMALMLRHLNDEVPPLRSRKPEIDPALAGWVEQMLAKSPRDRPAGAFEAWDDLEEIVIRVLGPRWRRRSRLIVTETAVDPQPGLTPSSVTDALPSRRRLNARWLVVAIALLAVLGAGGAAAAIALSGGRGTAGTTGVTSSTTRTTVTTEAKRAEPRVRSVSLSDSTDAVTATFRLTGPALVATSLVTRDGDISDGHAVLEFRQRGITSATHGATSGPVAVLVRKGRGFLRIDVTTPSGSFTSLRMRRRNGHVVILQLAKAPPPASVTSTSHTTTTQTTTTQTTPTKPKKPILETG